MNYVCTIYTGRNSGWGVAKLAPELLVSLGCPRLRSWACGCPVRVDSKENQTYSGGLVIQVINMH